VCARVFKEPTLTPLQHFYFPLWGDEHKNKDTQKPVYVWGKLDSTCPVKEVGSGKIEKTLSLKLGLETAHIN
jgi:hypothetical protein